ncbi:MAG: sigma-70 family RNA polymerase sigma factor, partial [Actinomycetota bacterium]
MSAQQGYNDEYVAKLLIEYQTSKDPRTRDEVVEHMRPLVQHVARKFAGREPLEDLQSEGYLGLIRAVDRYTPGRGTRFSTFAMHLISGQIRHYLRDRGHLIRQPAWLQELDGRVQKAAAELEQRLQRQPTIAEIANATNLSEEGVEELMTARQAAKVVRMEAPSDSGDQDYLEVDPEKFKSREYHTLQLPIEDRIVVEGALDKLKELERKVLYYFYYQDWNQSEIARKLGISCNYTGYVLRKGLKNMRERLPAERDAAAAHNEATDSPTVLDPVTGVYTREYFETRLAEEVSRAQHFGQSISVCCIRLPGHLSDTALAEIAAQVRARIRKADVAARTGDYEISVIFPNTGAVAEKVAIRLSEQL